MMKTKEWHLERAKSKTRKFYQVEIKIGFECNNNCSFCLNAQKRNFHNLSVAEIKEKIKEAKSLGVKEVALTGGEISIRKDFLEICKFVFDNKLYLEIQTNGRMFYYEELAGAFRDLPVRFLVSIHGDESVHNELTNTQSFEQTTKGIKNMKKNKCFVVTNTVINKHNYKLLPKINSFLYDFGVDRIQFTWMEAMGNALENYAELAVRYSQVKPVIKSILNFKK